MSKKNIVLRIMISLALLTFVAYHYFFNVPEIESEHALTYEIIEDFSPSDIIDRGGRVVLVNSDYGNYIEMTLNNYKEPLSIDIYLKDGQLLLIYKEEDQSEKRDRMLHIPINNMGQIKSTKIYKNGIRQTRIMLLETNLNEE